jgi:hypothetical protein
MKNKSFDYAYELDGNTHGNNVKKVYYGKTFNLVILKVK